MYILQIQFTSTIIFLVFAAGLQCFRFTVVVALA